jgi:drug/metabolite transporter (DMT)-like permease
MSAPTRRVAVAVWAGIVATPVLFAGVTMAVAPPPAMRSPELSGLFLWMAVAVAGLGVAIARVLPPRIRPREQGSRDAVAFTRLVVAWAILEGASMFALVAKLVTADPLLLVPWAIALVALVALYPSETRWKGNSVQPLQSNPGRMVRS